MAGAIGLAQRVPRTERGGGGRAVGQANGLCWLRTEQGRRHLTYQARNQSSPCTSWTIRQDSVVKWPPRVVLSHAACGKYNRAHLQS